MSDKHASIGYIGDELCATGYRLAGAQTFVSDAVTNLDELLESALQQTSLLLIGADVAAALPSERLHDLLRSLKPLVVVVPNIQGNKALPDLSTWLRGQLGMSA
jgi:vacuolar-type H+-ATPase subunit F/Vma7